MSKNNYMGKIDADYSGITIPNYDSVKHHQTPTDEIFNEIKQIIKEKNEISI